jgi:hypothetical protein
MFLFSIEPLLSRLWYGCGIACWFTWLNWYDIIYWLLTKWLRSLLFYCLRRILTVINRYVIIQFLNYKAILLSLSLTTFIKVSVNKHLQSFITPFLCHHSNTRSCALFSLFILKAFFCKSAKKHMLVLCVLTRKSTQRSLVLYLVTTYFK